MILRHLPLFFIIMLLPMSLQATSIYQGEVQQGNTIYSDQPIGSKVTISEPLVLKNSKANETSITTRKVSSNPYQVFNLIAPVSQQTIRNSQGEVLAKAQITPKLRTKDHIQWFMDNKLVAETTETQIELKNIDRGKHTIQAKLYNKNEQVLMSSNQVIFYLHRPFISK